MKALAVHLTGCIIALAAAGASGQVARPPVMDSIPPAWTAIDVAWKGDWAATLEANPESAWEAAINADASLQGARGTITLLRRIELRKAMIAHFPGDTDHHVEAYLTIADAYEKLRSPWWRAYSLTALVRAVPRRRDVVAAAYAKLLDDSFDTGIRHPSMNCWRGAAWDVLDLNGQGAIADDHPAVAAALKHLAAALLSQRPFDYDSAVRFRTHARRLSGKVAAADKAMGDLLAGVGHYSLATVAYRHVKGARVFELGAGVPSGQIGGLRRNLELDTRWEALKRDPMLVAQPAARINVLQEILDTSARAGALLREDDHHYVSFWNAAAEALRNLPAKDLAALGRAQDDAVRNLVAEIRRTGDRRELTRLARRYPWAPSVHELLIELGERDLRAGRRQWACASFRDAGLHAWDPALKAQAAIGLWLTAAQDNLSASELSAATAGVADDVMVPWRGGTMAAGELKKQLLARGDAVAVPVRLSAPRGPPAELPATWSPPPPAGRLPAEEQSHASWPVVSVQRLGDSSLVAGAAQIARYSGGGRPTWVQTRPPPAPGASDRYPQAVAAADNWWMAPARRAARGLPSRSDGGEAFYCLWGAAPHETVAAFDARSGRELWNTRTDARRQSVRVLTHPVSVDGGVYVLAADTRQDPPMLLLSCLDAADGSLLWEQPMGSPDGARVDPALGGWGVSVQGGAVYCSTNMGIVARCDVRDGTVEWVTGYSGAVAVGRTADALNREGSAAVISGQKVLTAPRDHTGVMALNRATGKILWESPLVPSDVVVGLSGQLLITMTRHCLAGIDIETGQARWTRSFPEATSGQALLGGGVVSVVSRGGVYRISAATGELIETGEPVIAGAGLEAIVLPQGKVVNTSGPALPQPVAAAMGGEASTPLKLNTVWTIPCERPELMAAPDGEAFCVRTKRQVARVNLSPACRTVWTQLSRWPGRGGRWVGGRVIVRDAKRVTAFDAAGGRVLWSVELDFVPYEIKGDDKLVVVATHPNDWEPHAAAIDAESGKVIWSRAIGAGVRLRPDSEIYGLRFRKSHFAQGLRFARSEDGQAVISVFLPAIFGRAPGGWQLGEVSFDAATGRIRSVEPGLPNHNGVPIAAVVASSTVAYIGRDLRVALVRRGTLINQTLSWRRPVDMGATEVYPWAVRLEVSDSAGWAASFGTVFYYDIATQKETGVRLPIPPGGKTVQAILDARRIGTMLVIVSGHKARYLRPRERTERDMRWEPIPRKIFVDVFNLADGAYLGRRELPAVRCSPSYRLDYDAQVKILPGAIVVADLVGVHIFTGEFPR